ncbi:tRNA methyl transferase [Dissophora ornata]|nr:tRNA methyl transferase [Dissophora ornata]
MSGGVDSSMCAHILHNQGYDVTGLYMHNWNHQEETQDEVCTSDRDWADVQAVCEQIGIPARRLDFSRQYWNQVFEVMLQEYDRGRTPNPDVTCNREIKFGELIEWYSSTPSGWDYLATGHYARVEQDPVTGQARLLRAVDSNKDQTYYLSTLPEKVLRHAIFPLAQYDKPTVKKMAMTTGTVQLQNAATKKESMGICFVGQRRRFGEFLKEYLDTNPGPVRVDSVDGPQIGEHKGLFRYTVGQASGVTHGHQKWVVLRTDMPSNTLIVVDGTQNERLFSPGLVAEAWHWIAGRPPTKLFQAKALDKFPFTAQIRHRQVPQLCTIEPALEDASGVVDLASAKVFKVRFKNPQRAIAPGQQIVLYDQDECLGGAVIQSSLPS